MRGRLKELQIKILCEISLLEFSLIRKTMKYSSSNNRDRRSDYLVNRLIVFLEKHLWPSDLELVSTLRVKSNVCQETFQVTGSNLVLASSSIVCFNIKTARSILYMDN